MKFIQFAQIVGKLKSIKRTGWVNFNIPTPESVAEHSFRLAMLAMILAPKLKLDQLKTIKMSLIHDLGEAEIGDIVTMHGGKVLDNLPEKLLIERLALVQILALVENEEYIKLFDEYEANCTPEAKLVKELDKLEMAIQAYEYERKHNINLELFFETTRSKVASKEIKDILNEVEKLRAKD